MVAAGMRPIEPIPGNKKPWRSECLVCGTEGAPTLGAIRGGQGGCVPCGERKAADIQRARMLDPESTAAEMRAAGLDPQVVYPGATKPWRSTCLQCGRTVTPTLWSVRNGRRCKFCARHGIDLSGPSMVYVIAHEPWGAVKVGIGACSGQNNRLHQHQREGWTVFGTKEFATGAAAQDVEQAVLSQLRAKRLVPFLSKEVMPNGYTETASAAAVSAAELWVMVQEESVNTGAAEAEVDGPLRRPSAYGLIDPTVAIEQMRAGGWEPVDPLPWPREYCLAQRVHKLRHYRSATIERCLVPRIGMQIV